MLEAYLAYADYRDMLELARELVVEAAVAAHGEPVARRTADGVPVEVDLSGAWPVLTVAEAISRAAGEEVTADTSREQLVRLCERLKVPVDPAWSRGAVVLELYERLVGHHTQEPTFYLDFPTDVSPLTRRTATTRASPSAGTWWRSAPRSPRPTASSSTPSSSAAG